MKKVLLLTTAIGIGYIAGAMAMLVWAGRGLFETLHDDGEFFLDGDVFGYYED